jgi:putative transposase
MLQERFCRPIKQMIEENPFFGYRTAAPPGSRRNCCISPKNTVQRIFQRMRWQVKKRQVGFRPRVQGMPSVALVTNERWATDCTTVSVWSGRDDWATLALVMDCHSRELLGWHPSRSGRSNGRGRFKAGSERSFRHSATCPEGLFWFARTTY